MKTKKELMRLFLQLVDAEPDYQNNHAIISDKDFLSSLVESKRIDQYYLVYAVEDLIKAADIKPSVVKEVWNELNKEANLTIKQIVKLVYNHQG